MTPLSSFLLVVACAALLQGGCEAQRERSRQQQSPRDSEEYDIGYCNPTALYKITVSLPPRVYPGPDNTVEPQNVCRSQGFTPACTELVFTNNDGGAAPNVAASRPYDPLSNVIMNCVWDGYGRCPRGVTVTGLQKCV